MNIELNLPNKREGDSIDNNQEIKQMDIVANSQNDNLVKNENKPVNNQKAFKFNSDNNVKLANPTSKQINNLNEKPIFDSGDMDSIKEILVSKNQSQNQNLANENEVTPHKYLDCY
jgi:hypothetical protein